MKRRSRWRYIALAVTLAALGAITLSYRHATARAIRTPAAASSSDPHILLAEADRLAWVFNATKAAPLYSRAERLFVSSSDPAGALHARVGFLRATAEAGSFSQLSSYLSSSCRLPWCGPTQICFFGAWSRRAIPISSSTMQQPSRTGSRRRRSLTGSAKKGGRIERRANWESLDS